MVSRPSEPLRHYPKKASGSNDQLPSSRMNSLMILSSQLGTFDCHLFYLGSNLMLLSNNIYVHLYDSSFSNGWFHHQLVFCRCPSLLKVMRQHGGGAKKKGQQTWGRALVQRIPGRATECIGSLLVLVANALGHGFFGTRSRRSEHDSARSSNMCSWRQHKITNKACRSSLNTNTYYIENKVLNHTFVFFQPLAASLFQFHLFLHLFLSQFPSFLLLEPRHYRARGIHLPGFSQFCTWMCSHYTAFFSSSSTRLCHTKNWILKDFMLVIKRTQVILHHLVLSRWRWKTLRYS